MPFRVVRDSTWIVPSGISVRVVMKVSLISERGVPDASVAFEVLRSMTREPEVTSAAPFQTVFVRLDCVREALTLGDPSSLKTSRFPWSTRSW